MRRLRVIVSFFARGASVLPLLVYGHGSEFLDARLDVHEGGVELRIVADYGGNPMIANEAEARAALSDAIRVEVAGVGEPIRLDALAPLMIGPREAPDPESPMPPSLADPALPHALMEASWRWACAAEHLRFVVPQTSGQTVLFWLHEPGVQSPRWSMLAPSDFTPKVMVPARKWDWRWLWATLLVVSVGGALGLRRMTQS